ncbi:MAG: hypothetical protein HY226_03055 [Candidatus Vogelbacteria bacterium]|nr:hypothetical protein [Candidatus Vogelbacteria bacterium]
MQTTFIIKTDKNLRDDAKATAQELGIPLTTVINALLKQFVRDRKITISSEPSPSRSKITLWENISKEMDKEKNTKFSSADGLIKHLHLV